MTSPLAQGLKTRCAVLGIPCAPLGDGGLPPHCVLIDAGDDALVADLSGFPEDSRQRMGLVLTQYADDLRKSTQDALAIEGFSRQLSQSYEEVNLVYRLAKLLTSTGDERTAVQTMCDELRATLHYGWLAVRFDAGPAVLAALRGVLLASGDLPCTRQQLADRCRTLDPTVAGRVLTTNADAFAESAGTEVLAERIGPAGESIGILLAGGRRGDDPDVTSSELQLVEATANFLGLFHQNAFRFAEQRQQFLGTLHALSAAVDAKDPYTHGHSERVGLLASRMAARLGWDEDKVEAVRVAGLLHDIGKIGVPESVLRKPSRLTDDEFGQIKQHPATGHRILADLPSLTFHLPGVLHHHERWDGRGYPDRLVGEQIPMVARLLAFADTFDAMSSSRAYRKGMDRETVLGEIRKASGTQFDPALVDAFVTMDFTEFDKMLAVQEPQTIAA